MAKSAAVSVLGVTLDLLQAAFALVVLVVTSWKLFDGNVDGFKIDGSCLLDGSGSSDAISGTRFCVFAVAVAVISLIANFVFSCVGKVFKCVTLNACAASKLVSIVGDTALGVWWTVAFALFVRRGTAANSLGWPERSARDGVIAASFGAMVAFYADVVVTVCGMVMS